MNVHVVWTEWRRLGSQGVSVNVIGVYKSIGQAQSIVNKLRDKRKKNFVIGMTNVEMI